MNFHVTSWRRARFCHLGFILLLTCLLLQTVNADTFFQHDNCWMISLPILLILLGSLIVFIWCCRKERHKNGRLSADVEMLTADNKMLTEDNKMLTADNKMLTAEKMKLYADVEMLTEDKSKSSADVESLRSELEFRRCCSYAVNVTLDPETAHPRNILSEDRKSVRDGGTTQNLPDNPQRFDACPCVLGLECFTLGRHYWEVEVGDKTNWDLGVCKDSVSRKGMISLTPEYGYWVVTQRYGDEYWACTSPNTLLPLSVRPRAVGIFLDYEAGKVSFYDADNISHLFTFTHTFTEKLWPYFSPGLNRKGKNAAALRIRPVPEWE